MHILTNKDWGFFFSHTNSSQIIKIRSFDWHWNQNQFFPCTFRFVHIHSNWSESDYSAHILTNKNCFSPTYIPHSLYFSMHIQTNQDLIFSCSLWLKSNLFIQSKQILISFLALYSSWRRLTTAFVCIGLWSSPVYNPVLLLVCFLLVFMCAVFKFKLEFPSFDTKYRLSLTSPAMNS